MDIHAMKDEDKTKTQLIYELTGLRQRNAELEETFRQFRKTAEDLDKELENISMELAISLSEVFEALKKISSGDPEVRISEESEFEIISKLKYMVNLTAKDIGEMVDQSHEFAMGLAEHFDVLHKVSKGDLNARVSGKSEVELLESLKNVTNETIESIDREITERKQAEENLREALATIKTLHGILPICSYCKKIRDDKGSWNQLEAYISEHTDAKFSHGLCSECAKKMYPEYYKE
jgi:prefoldin subunit 5